MDWLYLCILAFLVVIAGVMVGLNLLGVPPLWILFVALILLAVALLVAARGPGRPDGGAS